MSESAWNVALRNNHLAGFNIIGQLHHVRKVSRGIASADLKNIHQPIVQARDGLELQDAVELALKMTVTLR